MSIVETTTAELFHILPSLVSSITGTPVYRALDTKALESYRKTGFLIPREGDSFVAGNGVFFYMDPKPMRLFKRPLIVLASFEKLSDGRKTIDTRVRGYDLEAMEALDKERGRGNYNGYDLWLKILQDDTITLQLAEIPIYPNGLPIYTRRTPIGADELDFEIVLTDVPPDKPSNEAICTDF